MNFGERTFCRFSNLCYIIDPFRSISVAHAAGARLRRAQRAQGYSRNVARAPAFSLESFIHRPKRTKQEKCLGNRLHIRFASKTQFLLPTPSFRNRDNKCDTIGNPLSLLRGLIASIFLVRSPPALSFFLWKPVLSFPFC